MLARCSISLADLPPLTAPPTPPTQVLHFGEVDSYSWADQHLEVSNAMAGLPLTWRAPKAHPYYSIEPAGGSLAPGESVQVLARYLPRALGHHRSLLPLQVTGKQGQVLQEVAVEVMGFSERPGSSKFLPGGTDKLPEHFTRPAHLVDESQAATAALTSQVRTEWHLMSGSD